MRVLALETTLAACSVALLRDGEVAARRFEVIGRGHAEALMPMIEKVRAEAGIELTGLDLLAVTVGPGTFTGVRIGLAAARGLALATGVPLVGVTTLAAVAEGARDAFGGALLVALDAKRDAVYAQAFDGAAALGEPALLQPDEAAALAPAGPGLIIGTGAEVVSRALRPRRPEWRRDLGAGLPDAAAVARLAARRDPGDHLGPTAPAPLYLRSSDATLPRTTAKGPA